jgi:WhiB family redox-sensing transcriptional regulator
MKAADPAAGSAALVVARPSSRGGPVPASFTGTTTEEERQVLTATVPLDEAELAHLLDTVPSGSATLPCRSHHDPDLWFAESPAELERAKQLCTDCPIRLACLDSALSRQEPWGVWGGEIFEHGTVIPRKRPRGRPSKASLERERAERERAAQETAA